MTLENGELRKGSRAVRRMDSSSRPMSYPSIPVVFQDNGGGRSVEAVFEESGEASGDILESEQDSFDLHMGSIPSSVTSILAATHVKIGSPEQLERPIDRKRFSMPAIAVQTTPVTARTNVPTRMSGEHRRRSGLTSGPSSPRFSLVLSGAGKRKSISTSTQADIAGADASGWTEQAVVGGGLAAAKLNEILERVKQTEM